VYLAIFLKQRLNNTAREARIRVNKTFDVVNCPLSARTWSNSSRSDLSQYSFTLSSRTWSAIGRSDLSLYFFYLSL